jgi:hypothetical protein
MDTNTIIILIATQLLTTITIILAVINQSNNLNKKYDDLKDEIINLKLNIKDINVNLYLINERLNILGFSNKFNNGVHPSKEQELEYRK